MPEKSVIFASTVKNYYETKKNEVVLKKRENGVILSISNKTDSIGEKGEEDYMRRYVMFA